MGLLRELRNPTKKDVKIQGMYIKVHAQVGVKKESVIAVSPERYDIAVREPAERNLANARIRVLLARTLALDPKQVRLISGHQSPHKIFAIATSL